MTSNQSLQKPLLRKLVQSRYLDLFGAGLVVAVCIVRDFLGTSYQGGEVSFGNALSAVLSSIPEGAYPLGVMATIGAVISLMSTRLTGKQQNLGNVLNVVASVNSGINDFLFGNGSAIITYPITFFIAGYAVKRWSKGEQIKPIDQRYYLLVVSGLVVAFVLVWLGAYLFGGRTETGFLIVVAITFGLSLGANMATAFKYEETWLSWIIYNIVQLIKNLMLANLANVVKYLFYLGNAAITFGDWKWNRDMTTPAAA